ncbi:VOC family protein [Crossiella sp. CA-258035]|uniref:VOC family protein n=1 Tax=Crossiella sp. CA-258035 TaxID=2981138 RepID=UPI0024BC7C67|nr:VOC family protein [Crossiella sp. CA-258035]WHT18604.1 VOC family protein [Crossiella sp. CA-258035]
MATEWHLTIDCNDAVRMSAFWEVALRYVKKPPPAGWDSWQAFFDFKGYEDTDDFFEGAYLSDPDGTRPSFFFQEVPEKHQGKNWFHLDLKVSGGRTRPAAERVPLIEAEVARLTAAGGRVLRRVEQDGALDFVIMLDPEDNQFCVA